MHLNILQVILILFYSLSVLGFFIDFVQRNQKVKRNAFWLLSLVWIVQTALFIFKTIEYNRLPMMTIFESMFIYSWILVTLSLVIRNFFKLDFWLLFVNFIGFSLLVISIFGGTVNISPILADLLILELLIIHVSFLLLSYGSFTLSFAFAFLYFIQHHMLKRKKWRKQMFRIGDLPKLEKASYTFAISGFPIFLLGILLGLVWAWIKFETVPWYDVKVVTSLVVILIYGTYLFLYTAGKRRGYQIALFNIAAFLIVIINFFLSSSYSTFHIW